MDGEGWATSVKKTESSEETVKNPRDRRAVSNSELAVGHGPKVNAGDTLKTTLPSPKVYLGA